MRLSEHPLQLNEDEAHGEEEHSGVHLVSWRWDELGPFATIFLFAVFSGVAKIGFHHAHFLSSRVPESCLLVLVGVGFGALIEFGEIATFPRYDSDLFFHYLLPPIILEAAYSLYNRAFLDNIRTILLFAVIGTAFNFMLIGGLLIAASELDVMGRIGPINVTSENGSVIVNDYQLSPVEIFTFSSLISAVDPVAVLAIFQEVGVNSDLYFIVFGESLLNDGVAVVFYNMMNAFAEISSRGDQVTAEDILLGCASFLTIAFGGLGIGVIFGLITALITRTTSQVEVVEPLIVLGMAYTAYFTTEIFHWSGIISLIGCGIVQAHYSFRNITDKSQITVDYFSKMLSSTMDSIIFLYLGKELLGKGNQWEWGEFSPGFTAWSLTLCLVIRFIGVYFFTFILNRYRVTAINLKEQFIMAYGGLRGAVGFSLVISIDRAVIPVVNMFISTTLVIVMCTIWIQGGTIKPLVNLLNIDKESEEQKGLIDELNGFITTHLTNGIRVISGRTGFNYFLVKFDQLDEKYLQKVFLNQDRKTEYEKMIEELTWEHYLENIRQPVKTDRKQGIINHGFHVEDKLSKEPAGILNQFRPERDLLSPDDSMRSRRASLASIVSRVSRTSVLYSSANMPDKKNSDKEVLRDALRSMRGLTVKEGQLRRDSIRNNRIAREAWASNRRPGTTDGRIRSISENND